MPPKKRSQKNGAKKAEDAQTSTVHVSSPKVFDASSSNFGLSANEFGPLESENYLYTQQYTEPVEDRTEELVPYHIMLETHFLYLVLLVIGHVRDFIDSIFDKSYRGVHKESDGYAPILTDFDSFYTRRFKARLQDIFSIPSTGVPGREILIYEREFMPETFFELRDDYFKNDPYACVNLSSYNYLGFAQSKGACADHSEKTVSELGIVSGGTRFAGGDHILLEQTEQLVADFIGKESSMIFSMGYGTNAMLISNLVNKNCLVLSDQLNHASLRTGIRVSGAVIKVFKHNNMEELEKLIREQIAQGQPRTRRPWEKILIIFEGLYSMEGTMCNLPALVELRRKYGVYLFMDEAHSVGAMGRTGRGICEYYNISASEVDLLMGTFTKSFGSVGGYIAGDHEVIDRLRVSNMCTVYGEAPAPPALSQIQTSIRIIKGEINPGEGEMRLRRLAFNSRYFKVALRRMGFIVCGHIDSPVIPCFVYHPTKMPLSARWMRKCNIAIVLVGYPATDLATARIRFCMSSALTKSDLDYVLQKMDEMGDDLRLKVAVGLDGNPAPREKFVDFKDNLWQEVLDPTLH